MFFSKNKRGFSRFHDHANSDKDDWMRELIQFIRVQCVGDPVKKVVLIQEVQKKSHSSLLDTNSNNNYKLDQWKNFYAKELQEFHKHLECFLSRHHQTDSQSLAAWIRRFVFSRS